MPRIAIVEVTGPFVNGKKKGHRLTLPANDPTLASWVASGQVRVTYKEVSAVPDLTPNQRTEALAQRVAGELGSLGGEASRLTEQDRRSLWGRVRSLPGVQVAVLALLGLSLAAGEDEQAVAAPPAPPAPEPEATDDGTLAELRTMLGLAEDADTDAILDAVEDLTREADEEPDAPKAGDEIPAAAAVLVAEVLAHPEAFTLEGVRLVAGKAGIELPEKGTKASVLEVFALAVEGAKAPTPPAPPAPEPPKAAAPTAPAVPFMDEG